MNYKGKKEMVAGSIHKEIEETYQLKQLGFIGIPIWRNKEKVRWEMWLLTGYLIDSNYWYIFEYDNTSMALRKDSLSFRDMCWNIYKFMIKIMQWGGSGWE